MTRMRLTRLYILVIIISFVSLVSFLLIVSLKIEIDYILYFLNIVNQERGYSTPKIQKNH